MHKPCTCTPAVPGLKARILPCLVLTAKDEPKAEVRLAMMFTSACLVLAIARSDGHLLETGEVPYDQDVDCVLSDWVKYTKCTNKCGGGTYQRLRDVLVAQSGNGEHCGPLLEVLVRGKHCYSILYRTDFNVNPFRTTTTLQQGLQH